MSIAEKTDLCTMVKNTTSLELLAPARDLVTGIAAIDSGADAVYIGGPGFGARAAATNTLADIAALVRHAHPFGAKVFATVNTLLTDDQFPEAVSLIGHLYNAGVDAIIIQDPGLLQHPLPPVPLHASTQFHNFTPEKVKFLEDVGISRVVLARELTLQEIAAIRAVTEVELEFFVHGALCVSLSGQCYLSHALTGRSANKGVCSQPCRSYYSLFDEKGGQLAHNKHLLSMKDLNLSVHIARLAEAGITSFKIEGRLKDEKYVRNITAHYSRLLDSFIAANPGYRRASAGRADVLFEPDPERSFNRGFTSYFIEGRQPGIHSPDGAGAVGKLVGTVRQVRRDHLVVDLIDPVVNGDGLGFYDGAGRQMGVRINRADGNRLFPLSLDGLREGTKLFRNHDQAFEALLNRLPAVRRLDVSATLDETAEGISLSFTTGSISVVVSKPVEKTDLREAAGFFAFVAGQVGKSGDTIFAVSEVTVNCRPLLIRAAVLNALRREGLAALHQALLHAFPKPVRAVRGSTVSYPDPVIDFRGNVINQHAREFFEKHGVVVGEEGMERGIAVTDKPLMTTRHCLRYAFNACPKQPDSGPSDGNSSWWLTDSHHVFQLTFDCRRCLMEVSLPGDLEVVPLQAKPSTK